MQWTETVIIDAPVDVVSAAVRDQRHVMAWSAWPEATGFTCAVEGGATSAGSQIVFRDRNGTVQGRQRIVDVPFPSPLRHLIGFGMRRWVRGLHRKDLDQLRSYVEAADHGTLAD